MRDTYPIGRKQPRGPMVPAFTLRYKDGAILFEKVVDLSAAERKLVLDHFAAPFEGLKGRVEKDGTIVDDVVTLPPGSLEHFNAAVYMIPRPFARYPLPAGA